MKITTSRPPASFQPRSITIEFTSQAELNEITSAIGATPAATGLTLLESLQSLGGVSSGKYNRSTF
jgi:hypothetical protein